MWTIGIGRKMCPSLILDSLCLKRRMEVVPYRNNTFVSLSIPELCIVNLIIVQQSSIDSEGIAYRSPNCV